MRTRRSEKNNWEMKMFFANVFHAFVLCSHNIFIHEVFGGKIFSLLFMSAFYSRFHVFGFICKLRHMKIKTYFFGLISTRIFILGWMLLISELSLFWSIIWRMVLSNFFLECDILYLQPHFIFPKLLSYQTWQSIFMFFLVNSLASYFYQ